MKKLLLLFFCVSSLLHSEIKKNVTKKKPNKILVKAVIKKNEKKEKKSNEPEVKKAKVGLVFINENPNFKKLALDLCDIASNKEIEGIILIVDNYGGETSPYSVLHDLIKKIKLTKPVVSLVIRAFSCGYMLASSSNHVIAHNLSELGSIGTRLTVTRYKNTKLKNNEMIADMQVINFKAGEYKIIYDPYEADLTDEHKKYISERINDVYIEFLKIVCENRNLKFEDHKIWAEGKIFLAQEALKLGLIDEVGTIFEAQNKILELIQKRSPNVTYDKNIERVIFDDAKPEQQQAK